MLKNTSIEMWCEYCFIIYSFQFNYDQEKVKIIQY